ITPPRNVTAYTVALAISGVHVCERVAFTGLAMAGEAVDGVETSAGRITAPLVVLTGGPKLASGGRLAGVRIPAGGGRHPVARTRPPPPPPPHPGPLGFEPAARPYSRPPCG